jgi:hypothetical protein
VHVDELDVGDPARGRPCSRPPDRDRVDLDELEEALGPGPVEEHHAALGQGTCEQAGLGRQVALHRAVPVEVVLREVGVDGDGEAGPVDPVQVEPVAGDLGGDRIDPAVVEVPQESLEIRALRGGPHPGQPLPEHPRLHRADHARALAGGSERSLQQVADRGLAVRAGGADHGQLLAGMAVDHRRRRPHRRPGPTAPPAAGRAPAADAPPAGRPRRRRPPTRRGRAHRCGHPVRRRTASRPAPAGCRGSRRPPRPGRAPRRQAPLPPGGQRPPRRGSRSRRSWSWVQRRTGGSAPAGRTRSARAGA